MEKLENGMDVGTLVASKINDIVKGVFEFPTPPSANPIEDSLLMSPEGLRKKVVDDVFAFVDELLNNAEENVIMEFIELIGFEHFKETLEELKEKYGEECFTITLKGFLRGRLYSEVLLIINSAIEHILKGMRETQEKTNQEVEESPKEDKVVNLSGVMSAKGSTLRKR